MLFRVMKETIETVQNLACWVHFQGRDILVQCSHHQKKMPVAALCLMPPSSWAPHRPTQLTRTTWCGGRARTGDCPSTPILWSIERWRLPLYHLCLFVCCVLNVFYICGRAPTEQGCSRVISLGDPVMLVTSLTAVMRLNYKQFSPNWDSKNLVTISYFLNQVVCFILLLLSSMNHFKTVIPSLAEIVGCNLIST